MIWYPRVVQLLPKAFKEIQDKPPLRLKDLWGNLSMWLYINLQLQENLCPRVKRLKMGKF